MFCLYGICCRLFPCTFISNTRFETMYQKIFLIVEGFCSGLSFQFFLFGVMKKTCKYFCLIIGSDLQKFLGKKGCNFFYKLWFLNYLIFFKKNSKIYKKGKTEQKLLSFWQVGQNLLPLQRLELALNLWVNNGTLELRW